MNKETHICDLCERKVPTITEHHLIPREKGGRFEETAWLCVPCHKQVHALYSNYELAVRLNSIPKLKDDEKIKRYLKFIKKHPGDANFTIKQSKAIRKKGRY